MISICIDQYKTKLSTDFGQEVLDLKKQYSYQYIHIKTFEIQHLNLNFLTPLETVPSVGEK